MSELWKVRVRILVWLLLGAHGSFVWPKGILWEGKMMDHWPEETKKVGTE